MKIIAKNIGSTDVDVLGPLGEFVSVGGLAKARNLADFGHRLNIYRVAAEGAGTRALAYLEKGTSEDVLRVARNQLGHLNVFTFTRRPWWKFW